MIYKGRTETQRRKDRFPKQLIH